MRRGMPDRPAECWTRKVMLKPTNMIQKDSFPSASDMQPPGHLREPVVEPARRSRTPTRRTARSGGGRRRSRCRAAASRPGRSPGSRPRCRRSRTGPAAPRRTAAAVLKTICPRHSVAIQLKILMPVGTAITNEVSMKKASTTVRGRRGEHVVRPHQHAEERDRHRGRRDRLVAEDRLAREHRQDLRDHPEGRQDHDVDLGVPEEPEQVLPEHRVPAAGGVEERRCRSGGRSAASSPRPATDGSATISR